MNPQGYAGRYCSVPSRVEPGVVACNFIVSGMRIVRYPRPAGERATRVGPAGLSATGGSVPLGVVGVMLAVGLALLRLRRHAYAADP